MKKLILLALVITGLAQAPAMAADIEKGGITGKTVLGSVLSLVIWPGIGQALNDARGEKVVTHAVVGLLPPFRFWSAYDALVDRKGGYFKGKV